MQTSNASRFRRSLTTVAVAAFLVGCGGGEDQRMTDHSSDAANASSTGTEDITEIFATGGGDPAIMHREDVAQAEPASGATVGTAASLVSGVAETATVNDTDTDTDDLVESADTRKQVANAGKAVLPTDATDWATIMARVGTRGEALPMNTPRWWDWAQRSVMHAGNKVPAGMNKQIGWGHLLNAVDAGWTQNSIEMRKHQTLVCSRVNGQVRWALSQSGRIAGATFRADFARNANQPASVAHLNSDTLRANFPRGMAYHFWSNQGRQPIPSGYCGMVVLVEARAVKPNGQPLPANANSGLVLAMGADYWRDRTVGWANQTTNRSIGIAHLRRVTSNWDWYGFRTANDADIQVLRSQGVR